MFILGAIALWLIFGIVACIAHEYEQNNSVGPLPIIILSGPIGLFLLWYDPPFKRYN